MDWKIGLIFLGLGVLLHLPTAQWALHWDSFSWIGIELLLWGLAPIALVCAGARNFNPSARGESHRATISSIYPCLLIAFASLLWGICSGTAGWSLRGISIAVSCFLVLLLNSTNQRLYQMVALGMLAPVSTWTFAHQIHWVGQKLATALAGSVLDLGKVYHFYKGNVIGLVSTDFLENQQCSGVRLFGTSLLLVLTLGFLSGYSWFRMVYLTIVALFWIVVWNAMRIAYCVWIQDGQSTLIQHNFVLYDVVCLLGILFFTWSADQFYSALTYKEKDSDRESEKQDAALAGSTLGNVSTRPTSNASLLGIVLSGVAIAGIVGLGGWQLYRWFGLTNGGSRTLSSEQVDQILDGLEFKTSLKDGWVISRTQGAAEGFAPIFRPLARWPHEQWELTNERLKGSTMKLRVDGLWTDAIAPQWLWQWYGWKTGASTLPESTGPNQDAVAFGMSRSIVEEGYVITKRLYLPDPSDSRSRYVQVSLVQESVRHIADPQQSLQRDMFPALYDEIQGGFNASHSTGQAGIEAP